MKQFLPFLIVLPSTVYWLLSLWCGRRFFNRPAPVARELPPITILKPVKGLDGESLENFRTFCRLDYPQYQIVFAVADAADPVVAVIGRLREEFPQHDIELVIDPTVYGPNYKVANLLNGYRRAKYDIIAVSDSDIRVPTDYLHDLAARFSDRAVGLVTSLYRTTAVPGVAAALEATGFDAEMMPNVMVALQLEGLSFALGASIAVRREALEKIGGFRVLADFLADDYQIGNRVAAAGYRLDLSPLAVESIMKDEAFGDLLARQVRWGRTMRVSRPGGYAASVITHPFPQMVAAFVAGGGGGTAWGALGLLLAVRSVTALAFSRCWLRDRLFPRYLWLLPLRDLLSFLLWLAAFAGNRVTWRGHRFVLRPGGRMEEVER